MLGGGYTRTDFAPAPQLRGEFYMDTVRDMRASLEAGRDIYTQVERVKIIIPGAIASIVVHNVTDEHRARWADQYRAWKAGQEPVVSGTPLEEWSLLNPAAIAELKHLQIRTVEELAGLSDVAVQNVGMGGPMLRERAKAWLSDAEHESFTNKLVQQNDVLRSEVATLRNQVEQLSHHLLTLAQSSWRYRDSVPDFQRYVPGEDDPVEQAKGPALPGINGSSGIRVNSALDALAMLTQRPRRQRQPRPESRPEPEPELETEVETEIEADDEVAAAA